MRVYIAYKFSRIKNKDETINALKQISDKLSKYTESFLLLRDMYDWDFNNRKYHSSFNFIAKKLIKADVVLFLHNAEGFSFGMFVERVIATLLGKKQIHIYDTRFVFQNEELLTFDDGKSLNTVLSLVKDKLQSFEEKAKATA